MITKNVYINDFGMQIIICIISAAVAVALAVGLIIDVRLLIKKRNSISGKKKLGIIVRIIIAGLFIPTFGYCFVTFLLMILQ